ncbi:hypothetical protein FRC12_019692 [Ceratobasidium sp. 428]|nr:hypothetical protein FRC12_019692 [Ceratobasidium sp. 428]
MVREQYRRQAVARAAGVRLEEEDPAPSECDPLEFDLVHNNKERRAAKEAEASGTTPPGRKRKPTCRDLFGYEREVIIAAKIRILAYSLREGALQTRGTFARWSVKCWIKAMREVTPHLDPHAPTSDIQQIMINSLATGRGRFKDPVRPLVEYRLGFIKPPMTNEDVNHNLEVFNSAHPNMFHCLCQNPIYGHYENDLLKHAIAVTEFANPNAPGAAHSKWFNPVPLTTVVFVLAIFCLEEWETGHFRPRDLSMTDMLNNKYSGAVRPEQPYRQPITLRGDIHPDTPELDSEGEPRTEDAPVEESSGKLGF